MAALTNLHVFSHPSIRNREKAGKRRFVHIVHILIMNWLRSVLAMAFLLRLPFCRIHCNIFYYSMIFKWIANDAIVKQFECEF